MRPFIVGLLERYARAVPLFRSRRALAAAVGTVACRARLEPALKKRILALEIAISPREARISALKSAISAREKRISAPVKGIAKPGKRIAEPEKRKATPKKRIAGLEEPIAPAEKRIARSEKGIARLEEPFSLREMRRALQITSFTGRVIRFSRGAMPLAARGIVFTHAAIRFIA
jgi:uncharacterized coiled-coil protein SlyX